MSVMLLRIIFAGLLLATVASKAQVPTDFSRDDVSGIVIKVLNQHGLSARADIPEERNVLRDAVHFRAPGCDGIIEVLPIYINLQEAPLFDAVIRPSYTKRFAYLDRIWLTEDRLGMRLVWLKYKALSIFGLSRFVTIPVGLLVASPPSCHIAQTVDWSLVWDRRTIASARL